MKKFFSTMLSLAVIVFMTGLGTAVAQKGGGRGPSPGAGRPATGGIEHAETKANPQGVSHGIENAESKQAAHKGDKDVDKDKDDKDKVKTNKGKHKGKGKKKTTTTPPKS